MKRIKNALCFLTCFSILSSTFLSSGLFASATDDGASGGNLTWNYSSGVLTVSGTGEMENTLSEEWAEYQDNINSVVVGEGVTSISDAAFYYCHELQTVSLPSTLRIIGDQAFSSCDSLASIDIPEGVTSIEPFTFSGCVSLYDVTLPSTLTSIGGHAFASTPMKSIELPDSLSEIGYYAFAYTNLASIDLPDSLSVISTRAFYNTKLTSITIPENVLSVGEGCFSMCENLTEIVYEGKATEILYVDVSEANNYSNEIVMSGYADSEAEKYARDCGFAFLRLDDPLTGIEIASEPFAVEYPIDGAFIENGIAINLIYESGEKNRADKSFTITAPKLETAGSSTGTVSFLDYSATFDVTVSETLELPETSHPILPYVDEEYTYTCPGNPEAIEVFFSDKFDISEATLIVLDKNDNIVEKFNGSMSAITSVKVYGDTVKLRLIETDDLSIENHFGFEVAAVVPIDSTLATGSCGEDLTWDINLDGTMTISGTGTVLECATADDGTFIDVYSYIVTDVVLETDSITQIGSDAFYGFIKLKSFTIPANVTKIGNRAFSYSGLTDITVPKTVTELGDGMFCGCRELKSAAIYSEISYLPDEIFSGSTLESCILPDTLISIGDGAFSDTSIKQFDLSGILTIGSSAFAYTNLESVTIPASVIDIGSGAFNACKQMQWIVFESAGTPATPIDDQNQCVAFGPSDSPAKAQCGLEGRRFIVTDEIESISVSKLPDKVEFRIGSELETEGLELTVNYNSGYSDTVSVGYTTSGFESLSEGTKTVDVNLFGAVTSFDVTVSATAAIKYPESKHDYLNNTNQTWHYESLDPADSLKLDFSEYTKTETNYDFIILTDESGKQIGKFTGTELSGATIYVKGSSFDITLTSDSGLCDYGFSFTSIEAVSIEDTVTTGTFNDNFTWTYTAATGELVLSGNGEITDFSDIDFSSISVGLESLIIQDGITSIPYGMFKECELLESVTLPDTLTDIGDYAFYQCVKLKDIEIPSSVQSIGLSAFYHCESLKSITIPSGVTEIKYMTFYGCISLESIEFLGSITSFDSYCFAYCYSLKSFELPDTATEIAESMFTNCIQLNNVVIPSSYTSIGSSAFEGCMSLDSIIIPDTVSGIGSSAFTYCYSLEEIILPDGITSISYALFADCVKLSSVNIPDTVAYIASYAFMNCDSLETITISNYATSFDMAVFGDDTKIVVSCNAGSPIFCYCVENSIAYSLQNAEFTSASVARLPIRTVYAVNEPLSVDGLMLSVVLDNGYTFSPDSNSLEYSYDFSEVGERIVTVSYYGLTTTFTCTVDATYCAYPESIHNYDNGSHEEWYYTHHEKVDALKLTFSEECSLEDDYDYVYIYNEDGSLVGAFTGDKLSGAVIGVYGDSFRIVLISDDGTSEYGFAINEIAAATVDEIADSGECGANLSWELDIFGNLTIAGEGLMTANSGFEDGFVRTVTISEGVTGISGYAFYNNQMLLYVSLPESLRVINAYAFAYCNNLTSISIPAGVDQIEEGAFAYSGIIEAILPEGLTVLGTSMFGNCPNLTELIIPGSITEIPEEFAYSCMNLESVIINDGVESILNSAFAYCGKSFESIVVPASVTAFGSSVFKSDNNLVIYGDEGSVAQEYASLNGIAFSAGGMPIDYLYGDANADGAINTFDAVFVLQYTSYSVDMTELQLTQADVDANGDVNPADALMILNYLAFRIDSFPSEA